MVSRLSPDPAPSNGTPPSPAPGGPWYDPLLEAWEDPRRRRWVIAGAAGIAALLLVLLISPLVAGRRAPAPLTPAAAPDAAPAAPEAQPAPAQPAPPAEAPAAPAVPLFQRLLPPALQQLATGEVVLKALPLLLGLFWLLSAWLVDAEARRAFVVQEPWGERRTVAYSCLAVGCVFPLILAGLIFAAYGFVSFVIFVAARQSWAAGIQAGGVILLICLLGLALRGATARWISDRRAY
ncbi:MAG TPA: hypothetical protein VNK05_05525 [Chloroflexota bacterium]|nr:hypothetical protein [Chloroflexota bacterium]